MLDKYFYKTLNKIGKMSRFTDLFQETKGAPEVQEPVKTLETVPEKITTVKKTVKEDVTITANKTSK